MQKKLNIGDTFMEGNCTYKVTGRVPEGYLATMIKGMEEITSDDVKKSEPKIEEKAQQSDSLKKEITPVDVNYTKTQVNRMPNAQLEKLCKELGLEVGTGTEMKRAIIAKLGL